MMKKKELKRLVKELQFKNDNLLKVIKMQQKSMDELREMILYEKSETRRIAERFISTDIKFDPREN